MGLVPFFKILHAPCRSRLGLFGRWLVHVKNSCESLLMGWKTIRLAVVCVAAYAQAQTYDVVIRGGRVLDGCGNPWILADVAIQDGHFARIGKVDGRGRVEIDAKGKYVSPGWIDVMDQSGGVLPVNGLAENKLRMGVTTAIAGQGGTPVPAEKITEYFADLEQKGISINFGSYFSETQARVAGLGFEARPPTGAEPPPIEAIIAPATKPQPF